jgi:hypothetical protein
MRTVIKSLLSITIFGTVSCGSPPKESKVKVVEDIYKPVHTADQILDDLEFAYKHMEPVLIDNFFSEWQKNVKPNTVEFINQNETLVAVYNVFDTFYKPNDLMKIGNWACVDDINLNCEYIVIQNQIIYSIVNSKNINQVDLNISKKNLISNFRPQITSGCKSVLYLTDEYEESINDFLGKESSVPEKVAAMQPSQNQGNERKIELLKQYIPILHDYWGRIWQLETYPYVNRIIFNKSITKAKIEYYVGFQNGQVLLEKKGNKWVIKESKINQE